MKHENELNQKYFRLTWKEIKTKVRMQNKDRTVSKAENPGMALS